MKLFAKIANGWAVIYFRKKHQPRCLTRFWICLCTCKSVNWYHLNFPFSGGATLGPLNTTVIRLLPNDYPHGVVTVLQYPRVISDESSGIVNITILREKGTYGNVTVDCYTKSGSAVSKGGVSFYANVEYIFAQNNVKLVHHFNSSDGSQYLLVSNNIRVRLYQWKGTWHETEVGRKLQFFVVNLQICLLLLVKFSLSFLQTVYLRSVIDASFWDVHIYHGM